MMQEFTDLTGLVGAFVVALGRPEARVLLNPRVEHHNLAQEMSAVLLERGIIHLACLVVAH